MMGKLIMLVVIGTLFATIFLEALAGCGERTYFQNHTWVTGECLFIPYTPRMGRW